MLSADELHAAADSLYDLWQQGRQLETLPESLIPGDRPEAYAVQALLAARSGRPPFGWKIAATSRAGQAHINVDGPLAGRLLSERAFNSGASRPFAQNHMAVAEAEFAFRIGRHLPPRSSAYTQKEVLTAVECLHPAIEIPDSRFVDFTKVGAAQLIADNACAHEFVLGPEACASWRSMDLAAHEVRLTIITAAGAELVHEGQGVNVLGGPLIALTWLANELSRIGVTLESGQVVTTGTCVVPPAIGPHDHIAADFGALGVTTLQLTE